jgi:predicted Zn-dependent protease
MNRTGLKIHLHIMKLSLKNIAAVAAAVLITASCGVVSFTGRRQILMFSDGEIAALSDESYKEFMNTARLSSDLEATRMLKGVGQKMVSALESYMKKNGQEEVLSGLTWEFQLVDSAAVNAFCLPNGKIVFFDGILKYADTPDYIAVVMGHEMAHAIAKHGNERMSQEAAVNLLGSLASDAVGLKKGAAAQNLFNIGFGIGSQVGLLLPYSRKHEYEADKIGMYIMDIAGYDVNAAPEFWEKMLEGGTGMSNDFFSTHPSDAKRIAALKEAIKTKPNF